MTLPPLILPDARALPLGARRLVMGILNVTPDSFSDGGLHQSRERAIARALVMLDEGADLIDIGGESSRPGAQDISVEQELARVVPAIQGILRARPEAILSIDTKKAPVAQAALRAGAHIINDISGLGHDERMAEVAARHGAPLVLMHMRGTPDTMQQDTHYDDLLTELLAYFTQRLEWAQAAGVPRSQLVLDPGIGFGKSVEQNYQLIQELPALAALGCGILLGTSRKSMLGKLLGKPAQERLMGTAASVACGVMRGAHIVRVHDVAEMVDVVRVAEAVCTPSFARGL